MPELPLISGDECMSVLQRAGYHVARTKGSHFRLRCPGRRPVTVPRHRDLDRATLRSILRQAELSVEQFIELLES